MAKNDFINAESVIKSLTEAFLKHEKAIEESAIALSVLNKEYAKLPSDYINSQKEIISQNKKRTASEKEISEVEKERIRVQKQLDVTQAKIITSNDKNTQTLNQQKTVLKTLGSAYLELSQKQAESARRVQDLIARGKSATQTQNQYNKELKEAQNEFNKLNQRVLKADSAVGKFNRNVGNYPQQAMSGIKDLMGAFGILGGLGLAAGIATDIFKTTKELQSLDLALKQVTETDAKFAESQAFLRDISERFGVEINSLTKQFTQFYVSAKDKISGKEIQQIFASVSKAAGFMGLSVEQQERAFLALQQMMSKGTVSAEELRGQLGEALPGSFGILAKALNVNEKQLGEMMKQGQVLAADVLPKFAKELERAYGIENKDRVESLAAAQTRLSNSWTNFVRELNEGSGVVSNFFATITDEISKTIDAWTRFLALSGTTKQVFDKKTAEGYNSTLQSLQEQADKYGISLVEQAKRTQELAIKQRDQAKNERDYLIQRRNGYNEATEIARTLVGQANRITVANDLIKESTKQYGYWNGVIKATNQVIKTGKTTLDDDSLSKSVNTEETKKNTKAKKDNYDILARIYELERLRIDSQMKILDKESENETLYYKQREKLIKDFSEEQLKLANLTLAENLRLAKGRFVEEQIAYEKYYAELANITEDEEKKLLDIRKKANEDFREYMDKYGKLTDEEIFGLDVRNMPTEKMDDLINKWKEYKDGVDGAAKSTEKLKISTSEWFDLANKSLDLIGQHLQNSYDKELMRLESQKDLSIQYAGESTAAKEEIERQYEAKRRQLERKKAEQDKKLAIFSAVINTAEGVVSALPNIPLAVLVGALGAAQIALIASQPIPAYAEGTLNHSGGAMLINDGKGSNYTETVVTPDGKAKQYKGRNVLVDAPKGTKVFTHSQWNDELNGLLTSQNIGYGSKIFPTFESNYNGLTKEDLNAGISKLASVIQSKASIEIVRDAKGERIYAKEKGQRKEIQNARLHIKGFDV